MLANRPSAPAPEALPGNKQTQKLCFMDKLVRMLEECDPSVLRWSQTGESFLVADLKRFTSEVLRNYLRTTNFASFVRQLNYYGFHKMTHSGEAAEAVYEFKHEKFTRSNTHSVADIKRKVGADTPAPQVDALRAEIDELKARNRLLETELGKARRGVADASARAHAAEAELANALAKLKLGASCAVCEEGAVGGKKRKRDGCSQTAQLVPPSSPPDLADVACLFATGSDSPALRASPAAPALFDAPDLDCEWVCSPLSASPFDDLDAAVAALSHTHIHTQPSASQPRAVKQEMQDHREANPTPSAEQWFGDMDAACGTSFLDSPTCVSCDDVTALSPALPPALPPPTVRDESGLGDLSSPAFLSWTHSMTAQEPPAITSSEEVQTRVLAMSPQEQQAFLATLVSSLVEPSHAHSPAPVQAPALDCGLPPEALLTCLLPLRLVQLAVGSLLVRAAYADPALTHTLPPPPPLLSAH